MERQALEFKEDGLTRDQLELLDAYFEHKRWFKQKSKALFRDWERDKKELKDKTVKLIENEVEESKQNLLKELENYKIESQKEKKYQVLEEKRKEYEEKMKIIREIESDKKQ
jgi:hypothetical protein